MIPRHVREWAWGVRTAHAARLYQDLPFRVRMRLYAAVAVTPDGPRALAWMFRTRFRRWAAWPGDTWDNFRADQVAVVRKVCRGYIIADVATRAMIVMRAPGWPHEYPPGCVPCLIEIPDDDPAWVPR